MGKVNFSIVVQGLARTGFLILSVKDNRFVYVPEMTAVSSDQSSKTKFNFLSGVRYEHLLAGISGGVISTCILHPLDLLKIRCVTFVYGLTLTTARTEPDLEGKIPNFNLKKNTSYYNVIM